MIIQQGSFTMSNMDISGWLWGESSDYFSFNCVLQNVVIGGILLLQVESRGEYLVLDEVFGLHFWS
jgi:hypothetical protein